MRFEVALKKLRLSLSGSLTAVALTFLISCTNANPEITELSQLDGISFTDGEISVTQTNSIAIAGQCDARISQIEISFDNGANWSPLTSVDSTAQIGCGATQSFTTTVAPTQTQLTASAVTGAAKPTYSFKFRGTTAFAITKTAALSVVKISPDTRLASVYSASASQTSAGYNMKARVSFRTPTAQSNAAYRVQGTVQFQ